MLPLYFAPLQGYTDVAYRTLHHQIIGGITAYYTPFLRYEHHQIRNKDRRDVNYVLNQSTPTVPQIIARDTDEMRYLVDFLAEQGWRRVDINMGCPFHLQTTAHRGCSLLCCPERVEQLLTTAASYSDITFSVKMRLGLTSTTEALQLLPMFNASCITSITVHPRTGRQQYQGQPDWDAFGEFYKGCTKPLVVNGNITTREQIIALQQRFPRIQGVMIGRAFLAHPTLPMSLTSDTPPDTTEQWLTTLQLHNAILQEARQRLVDDKPILQRMQAFWEYQEEGMGRKLWKQVKKCHSMKQYPF